MIIVVAIPGDTKVCDKEWEKIEKYSLLKRYCQMMANEKGCCDSHCSWSIGAITTKFESLYSKPLNWDQNWSLLGTATIIRKVLSCEVSREEYCCKKSGLCLLSQQKLDIPKSHLCER